MGRTLIIVAGKDPTLAAGGAETYVRATGRAAIRAGYDPHIFCISNSSRTERTPFGVLYRAKSPFRPLRDLMLAGHYGYLIAAIDRFAARRRGPFLIHSFGPWGCVGVAAARRLARRGAACAAVTTAWSTFAHETQGKFRGLSRAHGWTVSLGLICRSIWSRFTVSPMEGRGFRRSQLVLVNYESVRRIVAADHGEAIRFRRIGYSSEAAFLRDSGIRAEAPDFLAALEPRDAPLIVAVSRHDARKGVDILLHALAKLRESGRRFRACLIGGDVLLAKHRALATELDLLDCTSLPGRVPDAYACLEHADIFALPSLEEGSGSMSLLEAMQAGVAAVVSRVDGLPEDVADRNNALLVRPGDAADLFINLRLLVDDAALRARLARQAHATFQTRFSADAFAAELGAVYSSLGLTPNGAARRVGGSASGGEAGQ